MLRVEKTTKPRSHIRLCNSLNKVKKYLTDSEEIFAKHITQKEEIIKVYRVTKKH